MEGNFYILLITALIPLLIGGIWYHPKVLGNVWMRTAEISEERARSGNMFIIFGLTYLFGLFIAYTLMGMTIHQLGIMQVFVQQPGFGEEGTDIQRYYEDFMANYGNIHRDFRHGALHGGFAAVAFALPLVAIVALFERRGWKYIGTHFGYWFITLMLMSGLICHFM